MQSSKFGYFIKSVFVFLLVIAGFLSLLKETVFLTRKAEVKELQTVLSENTLSQIKPFDNLKSEITPVSINKTADYQVRVPILMYHYIRTGIPAAETLSYGLSVSPEQLDQQLEYIQQNGYQTISFNDLFEALENKTPLPPKSVILTFDDGYRDFYTTAFPLLKKHNLRSVSFYVAGYSGYPNYMTWEMVKEVHKSGLVDVQSHTMGHLMLTKIPVEQAILEVKESKRVIEEKLGKRVDYFAYPYGDYNEQIVSIVRTAGYRLAFGTFPSSIQLKSQELVLNRVSIKGTDSFELFKEKLKR